MSKIVVHIIDGSVAHVFNEHGGSVTVIDENKMLEEGLSLEDIKATFDGYTAGLRDISISSPDNDVFKDKMETHLRRIENAIGEIDALRNLGYGFDQMRPVLSEAWAKLHKAHDEYKSILHKKRAISVDNEHVYMDIMAKTLRESGGEIKDLFKGFIDKEFEWCETVNPYMADAHTAMTPESEDLFRAYVTKSTNDGYAVNVEAFNPSPIFPPKQLFKAKTQNIQAANLLAGMISTLMNDKLSKKELESVNAIGVRALQKHHDLGVSKISADVGLKGALSQLKEIRQGSSTPEMK
ncbi:hypothetical protein [Sulfuricurvum sp.]|uniref:hypothetical protein n=1 Tax=Sulfuricurvum sp. TaxID=2025608 RepID=UPI002623D0E0|nr:hypothetical protein [Sulfuricurvum sp.]MDD3596668.1 hypothetical protein [Sulfuricurvum sp.]